MRLCINNWPQSRQPYAASLGLLFLAVLSTACSGDGQADNAAGPSTPGVRVVTTLYPLEYFVMRVGGASVEVVNLISPGVEAHDFEPTPGDIRRMESADLIVYNGVGFEPWIERALTAIGADGSAVIEAGLGLAEGSGGGPGVPDPHVWLDPLKAAEQVRKIRDGLSRVDPDGASGYTDNADSLLEEIEALHQRLRSGLADCRLRQFVTSHDAFGHLARRYDLGPVPISGLAPEAEPSAGDLASLADILEELGAGYVMAEPIVSSALAETLAREVGAELLTLHPLASLTAGEAGRGEDYFSLMNSNLDNLQTALECAR